MNIMLFDVETDGIPKWDKPSEDPSQPHLVQYTAVLTNADTQQEIEYVDMLIRPDGWVIPPVLSAIHGITQERALADGEPEAHAVRLFVAMTKKADIVSAFNVDFDLRMLRIAMLRAGMDKVRCDQHAQSIHKHCCMRQATPLARIPPTDKMMATGRKTWKSPKLAEAVKAILGEEMTDAHDARADVLYTQRLYFHMNPTGRPAK